MTSTPEQVIAKIREALEGDHERLCQGREYTCTCGHDDAVHQALTAALQSAADTPAPEPNVSGPQRRDNYEKALSGIIDEYEQRRDVLVADPDAKARFLILRSFELATATEGSDHG